MTGRRVAVTGGPAAGARWDRRTLLRAAAATAVTLAGGCGRTGPSIQVAVVWGGGELTNFRRVVAGFGDVRVVTAGNDIDAFLRARQLAGTSPDVAILPRPGLVVEYARRGWLREVTPSSGYAPPVGMADLLSTGGRRYGVWVKAAHKSLFWHLPSRLPEPPRSWDELVQLTRRLGGLARRGAGPAPLAVGAADGWVLTDWFENVLADVTGPGFYAALARGEADWRSPQVRAALDRLAELWSVAGAFPGGGRRALLTQFEDSVIDVVHRRRAVMVFEADFVADTAREFAAGEAARTFRFPGARRADRPLIVGGDAAVVFAGSERGAELVRWLSDGAVFGPWLDAGGYLSPDVSVPLDSYRDAVRRDLAADLRAAEAVRFDLSDQLPGPFTGSDGVGIWRIMQDFFADVTGGVAAGEAVRRATGQLAAAARSAGGGR
ncbi:ABC transporter substrate-binding protein [Micromonospora endolithica]|uniref:ABC transporter substrate-binding protein n=1 Tax=Micromonospora endolithica TaxID=230091 RepID=UPI0011AB9C45|nr:extracellular solute-binding protein [Micromonospora endolithica]TWJ22155.1 multiple sugar transport system substrate-binding protein/alpha-glucoside transport system substrate-binding protein [Micromonospora endolithica]